MPKGVNYGARIRKARKEMGLGQEEFAQRLAVTVQQVSRWENSKNFPIKAAWDSLVELTGKPMHWFFLDDETERRMRPKVNLGGKMSFADYVASFEEDLDESPSEKASEVDHFSGFLERLLAEWNRCQILWDFYCYGDTLRSHLESAEPDVASSVSSLWLQSVAEFLKASRALPRETLSRLLPGRFPPDTPPISSHRASENDSSVSSPSSLGCVDGNAFDEGDTFPKERFVGFFQDTDGTGHAYLVEAENHQKAEELVASYYEHEYCGDPGQVMCYTADELRELADRVESPDCELDVPRDFSIEESPPS